MWIVRIYLDLWTINVYIAFDRSVIVSYCYSLKKEEHFVTGTTCSIYVLNILASESLEALCVSSTNRVFIWIMFYIWLHWMRCVCSRLVFSTFRLLIVVFLLVHTVFVEDINYESCIVMCYPRKTLTSKIMPIKARIFWNAIAVPG